MKNTISFEKIDDSSVKISFDLGTIIATSFSSDRLDIFLKELRTTNQSDLKEILKIWYDSKLINFWFDPDLKDCLNI